MSAGISARQSLCFMCPERPQRILSTPTTRVPQEQHGCRSPRNDTFLLRLLPHAPVRSLAPRGGLLARTESTPYLSSISFSNACASTSFSDRISHAPIG